MPDHDPVGWTRTTLGSVIHLQRGHDLPARLRVPGSVPVVGSGEADGWHNLPAARGPGVVIGRATNLGQPKFVREDYWPLNTTLYVKDFLGNEPRWVYYLFRTLNLTGYNSGSVQPMLNRNYIQGVPVLLPPLPEQRAIAEVLGALDDKIEANRRLVRILLSHIAATWRLHFGMNGAEWPECPIGEVARVVGGSTPRTTVGAFWDGDIAWATPRDLSGLPSPPLLKTNRRITELGLQQISSGLLPRGTVLLSSRAPVGYLAIAEVPLAVNQGFIALVPGEALPGLYLWQWLSQHLDEILSRANGTTFLEVSKANFRPMPISLPPGELVQTWLEPAESMYAAIVAREVESNALVRLRDALLSKLLSGELRVRDAEPVVGEAV